MEINQQGKIMKKPILCLDFDGVCHSYTSGWQGVTNIPDPAVPGLFEFLEEATKVFDVQVYSTRSATDAGRLEMLRWFMDERKAWREKGGQGTEVLTISFPESKPPALVTIDDRAVLFTGVWPDVTELRAFKPWNK